MLALNCLRPLCALASCVFALRSGVSTNLKGNRIRVCVCKQQICCFDEISEVISTVTTGVNANHLRRSSGIQFGQCAPSRQHAASPPRLAQPRVAEACSLGARPGSGQATAECYPNQQRRRATLGEAAVKGRGFRVCVRTRHLNEESTTCRPCCPRNSLISRSRHEFSHRLFSPAEVAGARIFASPPAQSVSRRTVREAREDDSQRAL